jgi:hypothetical protein
MLPPDLALVCLPSELTRAKYSRGSFEFNLGMIVQSKIIQSHRQQLEHILRQLAYILTVMELEESILSTPEKKKSIASFIPKLFQKLTTADFRD